MEIGNWVPQVFYDLIGRIIPGASLLFLGFIFLQDTNQAKDILAYLFKESGVPTLTLFIVGLLISYLVGTLLGAIGFAIFFREWSTGKLNEIHATPPDNNNEGSSKGPCKSLEISGHDHGSKGHDHLLGHSNLQESQLAKVDSDAKEGAGRNDDQGRPEAGSDANKGAGQKYDKYQISYMYDAIQIHSPTAGSRLAKLRAETHMCRVLMIGFVILLVLFAYKNRVTWNTAYYQIVFVSFVLGVFSTYLFHVHLEMRARTLLVNSWHLLKNPPVDRGKP